MNSPKRYREQIIMMSKTELARKAEGSALTIDRKEVVQRCRPETRRKILLGLVLALSEKDKTFGNEG